MVDLFSQREHGARLVLAGGAGLAGRSTLAAVRWEATRSCRVAIRCHSGAMAILAPTGPSAAPSPVSPPSATTAPSSSVAPAPVGPAPATTIVVNVPPPQTSVLSTAADWAGVLSLVIAVVVLVVTARWNARADRQAADRYTAASDLDTLRQLNSMGIQPNSPLQPVARGLIDSLPTEDLPLWRYIIQIELVDHVPASHERLMAWLREREAPRSENEALWVQEAMVADVTAAMARCRAILDGRPTTRTT